MKSFLDEHFLLNNTTAQKLYHDFAKQLPVIDYHCHLSPQQIAEDVQFENLTQVWLNGDHYKWRAMRTNGVPEDFITGNKNDDEKFIAWAKTVPYTLRNPLYHWTHLELQRYFDINEILNETTAEKIYNACNEKLQTKEYSVRSLLKKMNVEIVCTTDDPVDSLQYHQQIKKDKFEIKVLPAFRPDAAINIDNNAAFNNYLLKLEATTNTSINSFDNYCTALKDRHDFFALNGCKVADNGLAQFYADDCSEAEAAVIFNKAINKKNINEAEIKKFKSFMLLQFAEWNFEKDWVQQYHVGALRNNNTRLFKQLGADTGFDSIGNSINAKALSEFLNKLDAKNKLAKTILYNLNPADNEMMATMIGNFNDGSVAGKIQWGSSWWFLDQKDGITKQLNTLSNMGLLSRFVGMLTDSRSFLSYPRHEYFRRILCNLFGEEIENGELPNDIQWTGKIIQGICYYNAKNYFDF